MTKLRIPKTSNNFKNPRKHPTHENQNKLNIKSISDISNVASFGNGRLGNQMCNFASQYSLFREFGMPSYLTEYSFDLLKNTFFIVTNVC